MTLPPLTLVLGGARSGKSAHAETLVESHASSGLYVATARIDDAEMEIRAAAHRERRGPFWTTAEAPLDPGAALADAAPGRPALVDCLTLWLNNLMAEGYDVETASEDLFAALAAAPGPVVLVANEVGLGIVPDNALARAFRDHAGRLNQAVAARADRVDFVAAGLVMPLKRGEAG